MYNPLYPCRPFVYLGGYRSPSIVPTRSRVSHVRILQTVAEVLTRSLDTRDLLPAALEALTRVTGHEISSLHLLSPDGLTLRLADDRSFSRELRKVNRRLVVGEGLIGRVAATGKSVHVANAARAPELLPAARAAVRRAGIRGFICVPIRARGRILGTLSLGRQVPRRFSAREIALVQTTADQIGLALDRARVYAETRRQLAASRQTERQLRHSEKLSAVGILASSVAHEVCNPLTSILGQAQLLLTQPDLSPTALERATIIVEQTSRAADILRALLGFARQHAPERGPCQLADQLRKVVALVGPQLEQAKVRLVTELAECPSVWADEHQIQQVLLNLVQNARQAMATQRGPRVLTLRLSATDGVARLEVLDTGPGIPARILPRIFDPFVTTKAAGEGSGLGLSISYGIIEQHGGRIRAENLSEGGAAFTIELRYRTRA